MQQCHPRIQRLKVLVVDDNQSMRKLLRTMLLSIGVQKIEEANDGFSALVVIPKTKPDLVIVDWEMPLLDGSEFLRIVRSPKEFSDPDIPIIMLTGHADRWRVVEAARYGANEFLIKPVSIKALHDRILDIVLRPRPSVMLKDYYGPMPRRVVALG